MCQYFGFKVKISQGFGLLKSKFGFNVKISQLFGL